MVVHTFSLRTWETSVGLVAQGSNRPMVYMPVILAPRKKSLRSAKLHTKTLCRSKEETEPPKVIHVVILSWSQVTI